MKGVLLAAMLALASLTALGGEFLVKTEHVLLYQGREESILVIHNPKEAILNSIVISFPARVKIVELTTYDGVLELTEQGNQVVLEGALLASGFVQLRWRPGVVLPSSARLSSATGTWTLGFPGPRAARPPEVHTFRSGDRAGAAIGRSEGRGEKLILRFSEPCNIVQLIGIGTSPVLEGSGMEFTIEGPFPEGSGVLVEWEPASSRLVAVRWDDREAFQGELAFPGFSARGTGPNRYLFRSSLPTGSAFRWDFGDGATGTGPEVRHVYTKPGHYLVTLVARDREGNEYVFQNWVTVTGASPSSEGMPANLPPVADPGGPYGPYDWYEDWRTEEPEYYVDVAFDASGSTDVDGRIVEYRWDFGDGSTEVTTTPHVTHRYLVSGGEKPAWLPGDPEGEGEEDIWRIPVTLTVVDDQGSSTTATTYVEVYALWWLGGPE